MTLRFKRLSRFGSAAAICLLGVPGVGTVAEAATNPLSVQTIHGYVDFHTAASLQSPLYGRLLLGEDAPLVSKVNRYWYEVEWQHHTLYITTNPHFTHLVETQSSAPSTNEVPSKHAQAVTHPTHAHAQGSSLGNGTTLSATEQHEAEKVIQVAKTQLGVPYWWGHQVPGVGFDCSNFTAWVYRTALGISFSGSSVYQRYHVGTPVPLSDLQMGDLLFFRTSTNATGGGHVGIYAGHGMVIEEGGGYRKVVEVPLATTWMGRALVFARQVIQ